MELVNPTVRAIQRQGVEDPDGLWARAAAELPWFRRWDQVLEWTRPSFRWFTGATTNLAYNCLDRHVQAGRSGHAALIAYTERGERSVHTYAQLLHQVERAAAALRGLGIGTGDRIAIYMPTCPEAIALMLAAVRIGAIHLVVFAGFGAGALADRIRLAGARAVFTTDVTWRKGGEVDLAGIVQGAVGSDPGCPEVERVVVLRRSGRDRDRGQAGWLDWEQFLALGEGHDGDFVELEANEPAYILATSGTTARPKLAVHTHGPHQVHIHAMGRWCFGMRPDDVWWATSDIGWVVGHSYIVYAPLLAGCTTIAYEGAIDHPDAGTVYRIVEECRVSGLFTSPTAVRLLMRYGTEPSRRHDLSSVERVVCAGEVLNPPAWEWFQKDVFADRIPVMDHMWQTETSGPIVGNPYGINALPIKPGSSGIMLPGIDGAIMTMDGKLCEPGEKGIFVIRRPFPGLTASLWGEPERYGRDYWQRIPEQDVYFSGDAASLDEDGYVWFSGRADEIIKIAAHRVGTIEVETAFLRHPAVAEAGVAGRADQLRGEVISAFVTLKEGHEPSNQLRAELVETVRRELGPVAVIGDLSFVSMLPKTRSGKIMRRVLRAVAAGTEPGDISTIEDEGSVAQARESWQRMQAEVAAQRADG
jgi:acetyl-CoA synthetase